MFKSNLKST